MSRLIPALLSDLPRLTKPQRRHLVELLGDGTTTLYWKMAHGTPQHRSAVALARLGLVYEEGSILTYDGGFALTAEGRRVAEALDEASA